jgi:hypothetical protein
MAKTPPGRLAPVALREQWEREDTEFTPWLAKDENIRLLGDALGVELEVQKQEADVGPFRADLLCKEVRSNHGSRGGSRKNIARRWTGSTA